MSLLEEQKRILDFVAYERARVFAAVEKVEADGNVADSLRKLVTHFFSVVDEKLEPLLTEIREFDGDASPDIASNDFQLLLSAMQTTFALFLAVIEQQRVIPRELYRYVAWFFEKAGCTPSFALRLHSELSTTTIGELLRSFFPKSRYKELTSAFDSDDFVLIQIPTYLSPMDRATDWPLVLHECVHAIEHRKRAVAARYPLLPRDWSTLMLQAKKGIQEASEALWTEEFVCDFLATHIAGPGYLWSFLRSYSAIAGVMTLPVTHPRTDERADRMIAHLRQQGFTYHADSAASLVQHVVADSGMAQFPQHCPVENADEIQAEYAKEISGTTRESFDIAVSDATTQDTDQLVSDFKRGRPILLEPDHLFTLLAFRDGCGEQAIAPLLADMIRLAGVRRNFVRFGLRG